MCQWLTVVLVYWPMKQQNSTKQGQYFYLIYCHQQISVKHITFLGKNVLLSFKQLTTVHKALNSQKILPVKVQPCNIACSSTIQMSQSMKLQCGNIWKCRTRNRELEEYRITTDICEKLHFLKVKHLLKLYGRTADIKKFQMHVINNLYIAQSSPSTGHSYSTGYKIPHYRTKILIIVVTKADTWPHTEDVQSSSNLYNLLLYDPTQYYPLL
jgi:hypothetical protein